jgi:hypothetical protein
LFEIISLEEKVGISVETGHHGAQYKVECTMVSVLTKKKKNQECTSSLCFRMSVGLSRTPNPQSNSRELCSDYLERIMNKDCRFWKWKNP